MKDYDIKFSISQQAFYGSDYHSIPDDAVPITEAEHMRLINGMNDNERRVYIGENGAFILSDQKPSGYHHWDAAIKQWAISPEDEARMRIDAATRKKSSLMSKANEQVNLLQDAVDVEIATPEEEALLLAWKKYRVLLNRINNSDVNIQWPEVPV